MRALGWLAVVLAVLVAVATLVWLQGAGGNAPVGQDGGEGPEVVEIPRAALNYAGNHTTLWGKVAALAHYDVVKTSEPLTCTDGVSIFPCHLSKTDVRPILNALRRVGVNATATPLKLSRVAVVMPPEGWRDVTVLGAWNVTSQHGWVVIVQAPIKKSLGEMRRIHEKAVEKLSGMNVTAVGFIADRLIVGTTNADSAAVEKIKKAVREIDPDVEVEVVYIGPAQPLVAWGTSR